MICAGGGGVPVVEAAGALHGVEAVIDKDLAAALLACELNADALLLLTDVPAIVEGYGTDNPRPIRRATPSELRALGLPAGSMGPKAEAACRFAELGGGLAAVARLDDAVEALAGRAGTIVTAFPGLDAVVHSVAAAGRRP